MLRIMEIINGIHALLIRKLLPTVKAEELSPTEMMILWKVHQKGTFRATDLAKKADVPPSTFTGIVDRLVAKNFLVRINDLEDRRSVLVKGTEELKELMQRIESACDAKLTDIFEGLPEDFLQNAVKDLQELHEYLLQNEELDHCEGVHRRKDSE